MNIPAPISSSSDSVTCAATSALRKFTCARAAHDVARQVLERRARCSAAWIAAPAPGRTRFR